MIFTEMYTVHIMVIILTRLGTTLDLLGTILSLMRNMRLMSRQNPLLTESIGFNAKIDASLIHRSLKQKSTMMANIYFAILMGYIMSTLGKILRNLMKTSAALIPVITPKLANVQMVIKLVTVRSH